LQPKLGGSTSIKLAALGSLSDHRSGVTLSRITVSTKPTASMRRTVSMRHDRGQQDCHRRDNQCSDSKKDCVFDEDPPRFRGTHTVSSDGYANKLDRGSADPVRREQGVLSVSDRPGLQPAEFSDMLPSPGDDRSTGGLRRLLRYRHVPTDEIEDLLRKCSCDCPPGPESRP